MKDLVQMPIESLAPMIESGEISPVELVRKMLERIEALNPVINAYITIDGKRAMLAAEAAEKEIVAGSYRGPLHGIPYSLKDIYATLHLPTTNGSKADIGHVADYESTVARRLKDAGAIMLGKVGMHEYAYGVTNDNQYFGPVHNPWKQGWIPGGSSGGSGAAVAASLSTFSMGTDTGGSIRIPAAACGVVGLKATYGRVSKFGVTTLSWSLDHAGPLTKTVKDSAYVLNVLAGHDRLDQDTVFYPVDDYTKWLEKEIKGMRIGVISNFFQDGLTADVKLAFDETVERLHKLGAIITPITVPSLKFVKNSHLTITRAEATSFHQNKLKAHLASYGEDIQDIMLSGEFILATEYLQAQKVRRLIQQDFNRVFEQVDVIVTPTLPAAGAAIGQEMIAYPDGAKESVLDAMIRLTSPFNLTGAPAITLPVTVNSEGLPIGMQFAAAPFEEKKLLQIAHQFERACTFNLQPPVELAI